MDGVGVGKEDEGETLFFELANGGPHRFDGGKDAVPCCAKFIVRSGEAETLGSPSDEFFFWNEAGFEVVFSGDELGDSFFAVGGV